ncbi:MAG TPA: AmmeMemoRadiSam system protein A [Anaerolineaceae bacterium]|jgi:AmmeMemoRadiSam system protein A|nr:AmmeMemoRadiSam system protein A [Anaerolineaceae bacterium]HPS32288.1 AmmeMemoRadiSam system protein A [Anaerolineaceae bacterium]
MPQKLTPDEWDALMRIAKEAVLAAANGRRPAALPSADLPPRLLEDGAVFVTLTKSGQLRGCIGSLEAWQPLAEDVRLRAYQAAVEDPRFPPLEPAELPRIEIEISRLTEPVALPYEHPEDLPRLLKPHQDGVILADGRRRATFLPQVWEQLPRPEEFLSHLCAKMGARPSLWREKVLDVWIYHVEEHKEKPEW